MYKYTRYIYIFVFRLMSWCVFYLRNTTLPAVIFKEFYLFKILFFFTLIMCIGQVKKKERSKIIATL